MVILKICDSEYFSADVLTVRLKPSPYNKQQRFTSKILSTHISIMSEDSLVSLNIN